MVFDQDATSEIILRAEYILIVEGGSLSIGSEEDPFMGEAVIELYGSIRSTELPNYGAKVRMTGSRILLQMSIILQSSKSVRKHFSHMAYDD